MLYRVLLLTSLILTICLLRPAYAVGYTVRNLAVDVEAETAIKAREEALVQARKNAFNILKDRLPVMMREVPAPNSDAIAAMVDNFEINREKLSKNRYLASVNVTFNERAVQTYLNRNMGYAGFDGNGSPFDRVLGQVVTGQIQNNRQRMQAGEHGDRFFGNRSDSTSVIRIPIAGIRQWIGIKKSLESIVSVKDVKLKELSARQAVINIVHAGSIYDLQNALIGRGMQLYANTDMHSDTVPYILVTRG